jgi:hypothetical protein
MSRKQNNTGLGVETGTDTRRALMGSRLPFSRQDAATYCRGVQTAGDEPRMTAKRAASLAASTGLLLTNPSSVQPHNLGMP